MLFWPVLCAAAIACSPTTQQSDPVAIPIQQSPPICSAALPSILAVEADSVQSQVTQQPAGHCLQCSQGQRLFYSPTTAADPVEAVGNGEAALSLQCGASICVCRDDGICCAATASPPDTVNILPFCQNNVCSMKVYIVGSDSDGFECSDGSAFTVEGQFSSAASSTPLPLNSSAYLAVDSVACNGQCVDGDAVVCDGPFVSA